MTTRTAPPRSRTTDDEAASVETVLAAVIEEASLPDPLRDAVSYAVLGGGKRIRPRVLLAACTAVGGRHDAALPPAAAMELVHCFSLVHDDLPALDDDRIRRGRPSLHVHAGEAMAILAGDVMLSLAFQQLTTLPAEPGSRLGRALSTATTAMVVGQVHDTLGTGSDERDDATRLQLIHESKTGALFRAACRMGGICGHADGPAMDALDACGRSLGLMYQVVDDLLDATASPQQVGKQTGKDAAAGKLTYPGVHGITGSRRIVESLRHDAHEALSTLDERARPLLDLCDELSNRAR